MNLIPLTAALFSLIIFVHPLEISHTAVDHSLKKLAKQMCMSTSSSEGGWYAGVEPATRASHHLSRAHSNFCPGTQDQQTGEHVSFPTEPSENFSLWKTTQICQKGPSH